MSKEKEEEVDEIVKIENEKKEKED